MKKYNRLFFVKGTTLLLGCLALLITACDSGSKVQNITKVAGYLYTTTNGEADNTILRLTRYEDGSVGNEKSFGTNGQGGTDSTAGGVARGDYDSQGAIKIIGDYLITVNGGDHLISLFKLDRSNGELTFLNNVQSGGERPVSVTFTKKPNSEDQYWAVVANQWNNPVIEHDGAGIERYPNDDFFKQDLTLPDATDALRNITLFSFDASNGAFIRVGDQPMMTYSREWGGPVTVTFSDDGTKLAVSTWGIPHLFSDEPSIDEMHSSRVYVYDFDTAIGEIANKRYFEENGIAGTTGINWAKNSNTVIHASNINQIISKSDNGLTILNDDGNVITKTQNFKTGAQGNQDYACWTVLSPAGDRLYVASFYTNVITPFVINGNGTVSHSLPFVLRDIDTPNFDSKDIYVTPDNKYLYNIGAFKTYSLNTFKISDTGLAYQSQYVFDETKAGRGEFKFHFVGLAGFAIDD